jgi:hypothetical protein
MWIFYFRPLILVNLTEGIMIMMNNDNEVEAIIEFEKFCKEIMQHFS